MFVDNFALSRYDTWELDTMVEQILRPDPFLLRTFFPRQVFFESQRIEFDIIDRGRRLAPFVSPLVAGKPMRREGHRTRALSPAYIKPTALILPQDSFTRLPGEGYGGRMSPQARFDALVAEHLDNHDQMLDNRLEWMAANAIVHASIVITGEDYPTTHVDFGRDASLSVQLVGASKWTASTSNPLQDIETAALNANRISKGAVITDLILDGLAWAALKAHASVQDLISMFYARHLPGQPQAAIDFGPRNVANQARYVGTLNGTFNLWVYDSYYTDDTGTDQPYLPPYTVIGAATGENGIQGAQYYGAIIDLEAGIRAQKMFSKSDVKFNPSGLELVSQSAPLVAPKRPNASFTITVN